jgi:hypothetical protein
MAGIERLNLDMVRTMVVIERKDELAKTNSESRLGEEGPTKSMGM